MWIEIFGTAMSVIVAVSLMQKNIRWLRIINGIGALGFAIYGSLIGALPVLGLNGLIFVVDIYYLFAMRNRDEVFDYLEIDGLKSVYVQKFVDFYLEDIHRFMPEFDRDDTEGIKGCLILRDILPVALILYRQSAPTVGEMVLDYSTPSYRDLRNTRYFFEYVMRRLDIGEMNELTARGSTPTHRKYLEKMGFQAEGEENLYRKIIKSLGKEDK